MKVGNPYFFNKTDKRVLKDGKEIVVYVSFLYKDIVSIENVEQGLLIRFKRVKRGSRFFYIFKRTKENGKYIGSKFLKLKKNHCLSIRFGDGELLVYCMEFKALEFLKFKIDKFFKEEKNTKIVPLQNKKIVKVVKKAIKNTSNA